MSIVSLILFSIAGLSLLSSLYFSLRLYILLEVLDYVYKNKKWLENYYFLYVFLKDYIRYIIILEDDMLIENY